MYGVCYRHAHIAVVCLYRGLSAKGEFQEHPSIPQPDGFAADGRYSGRNDKGVGFVC